ncbi:LPXTG cell wall anchor domain-containing protein [Jidongwangia harbinensis]|uniref:LPXTG cell wall anchor domain-containing protein n=1 Tax=Jidongwangia harbinensis TaxID=2878561 RepID=UPI001CDA216C|nr:LPXTG cell wall anchor domain-containing protein [Jidongwangia harbinensis]MCA2214079.1 LPXTG cell wall anchor domain-containing protein [Jidongwangia harbinensis]
MILATLAAIFVGPAAAHAAPYPIGEPASSVSDGVVPDGGTLTFSGSGFGAGELVQITAVYGGKVYVLKTVRASADGSFRTVVALSIVGSAVLTATGQESGVVVVQNVRVTADGDGGGDGDGGEALPTTGPSIGDMAGMLYGGVGAVLLGSGALWFTRRRRAGSAS